MLQVGQEMVLLKPIGPSMDRLPASVQAVQAAVTASAACQWCMHVPSPSGLIMSSTVTSRYGPSVPFNTILRLYSQKPSHTSTVP